MDKQNFDVYRLAGIERHDGTGAKNISVPAENINSSYTMNRTVFFSSNTRLHRNNLECNLYTTRCTLFSTLNEPCVVQNKSICLARKMTEATKR